MRWLCTDPERSDRAISKIHKLISEDRVNFVAPADYGPNTQLDIVIKGILGRIARVASEGGADLIKHRMAVR